MDRDILEEAEAAAILAPEQGQSSPECVARQSANLDDTNDAEWDWIGDEANNFSMTDYGLREISAEPIARPTQDHQPCQHASMFYDVANEHAGRINQVIDNSTCDSTLYTGFGTFKFPSPQQPYSALGRGDTRGQSNTGSSSSSITCTQPPGPPQSQPPSATSLRPVEPPSDILQWDHRLSNLCLRLSTRLQECEAVLGRSGSNASIGSAYPQSKETAQQQEHQEAVPMWTPNLLGEVLGDTTEYLTFARSYKVLLSEKGPAIGDGPPIGVIVVLNLLSAYLQLVGIYQRLLQWLYKSLQDTSASSPPSPSWPFSPAATVSAESSGSTRSGTQEGLQTLPGLQLAGFSIQQGGLQTKIMIDVILYQFTTMERLLGLPADLRVATTQREADIAGRGRDGGLFGCDQRVRDLLTAVCNMSGGLRDGGNVPSPLATTGHGVHVDYGGLDSILLLRKEIKSLQILLGI